MIYGISDDEAQELTDAQVQRKLCSLLDDMRLKRQWVAELSFERQEAEVDDRIAAAAGAQGPERGMSLRC